jgi:maltokinase-like protein
MALLHKATINPAKLDLLAAWLPGRDWYPGGGGPERVAAARFDDPAGAVGVEVFVVRAGDGPLLHTPMTYRDAPLEGADEWLIGTTEHSALGTRWVYDAVGDPVFIACATEAIRTGGREAEEYFEVDGVRQARRPLMALRGTGGDGSDGGELVVRRVLDATPATGAALLGMWSQEAGIVLAELRVS